MANTPLELEVAYLGPGINEVAEYVLEKRKCQIINFSAVILNQILITDL